MQGGEGRGAGTTDGQGKSEQEWTGRAGTARAGRRHAAGTAVQRQQARLPALPLCISGGPGWRGPEWSAHLRTRRGRRRCDQDGRRGRRRQRPRRRCPCSEQDEYRRSTRARVPGPGPGPVPATHAMRARRQTGTHTHNTHSRGQQPARRPVRAWAAPGTRRRWARPPVRRAFASRCLPLSELNPASAKACSCMPVAECGARVCMQNMEHAVGGGDVRGPGAGGPRRGGRKPAACLWLAVRGGMGVGGTRHGARGAEGRLTGAWPSPGAKHCTTTTAADDKAPRRLADCRLEALPCHLQACRQSRHINYMHHVQRLGSAPPPLSRLPLVLVPVAGHSRPRRASHDDPSCRARRMPAPMLKRTKPADGPATDTGRSEPAPAGGQGQCPRQQDDLCGCCGIGAWAEAGGGLSACWLVG